MIRKIFVGLLLLLVILAVVIALQPAHFEVVRSTEVHATAGDAFVYVNDFHHWDAWSPWAKRDPAMKVTFEGPASGTGATYSWDGNAEVGAGRMTILESRASELVRIRLDFLRPFAATNFTVFTFDPISGGTRVTWSMSGENNFLSKAFSLVADLDQMIGGDFEQGLAQLKAVVEGKAAATPERPL